MKNSIPFCTCADLSCPFHPTNHDKGCTPCIAKNLSENEIPSCFFRKANADMPRESYGFKDFAKAVSDKENAKRGE